MKSPSGMPPGDWMAYVVCNSTKSISPERLLKGGPWSCHSLRAVIHLPELKAANNSSEEVGLLHDPQKFFLVHLAVTVAICLVDHLLELLICHPLTKLLRHALQVLEGDFSRLVVIEEPERLQDLVLLRFETQSAHRHLQLLGIDGAAAVRVEEVESLLDFLLLLFSELLLLLPALVEAAERHSRRAAGHGRKLAAGRRAREGNK